jgi:hypothetical protein
VLSSDGVILENEDVRMVRASNTQNGISPILCGHLDFCLWIYRLDSLGFIDEIQAIAEI